MLVGLTKSQIAIVSAIFIFTLFGAMLVAWGLRRWNVRSAILISGKISPQSRNEHSRPHN